jgi:hypothetical protein
VEPRIKTERRAWPERARELLFKVPWLAVAVTASLVLLLFLAYALPMGIPGGRPDTYEGVVVDKSLTIHESEQGSWPRRRLHVRVEDGRVFLFPAGPELYESARVGMRIRKTAAAGVELSWTEFKSGEAVGGR